MTEVIKPANLDKVWARIGNKVTPEDSKIDSGWAVEIPTHEEFNFLSNKDSAAIAHFNQQGIPLWDSTTEYQANKSIVKGSDNNLYIAQTTGIGNNPVTDTLFTNWELYKISSRKNRVRLGLSLSNSWINGDISVQAEIVENVLHLMGTPSSGTTTTFTTVATLPAGYRPSATRYFSVFLDDTGSSGWVMIPMRVLSTGEIQNLVALPNNTGLILSGSFLL